MCLIAICVKKKPSAEIIRAGWESNSHGAGIAFLNRKTRQAEYLKSISSADDLIKVVEATPLPFVLHFRLASVGGKDELLTHPFEVTEKSELKKSGSAEKLLIHNGTESDWKKCLFAADISYGDDEPMSDTRAVAMIIAKNKNNRFLEIASGKYVVIGFEDKKDDIGIRYYGDFEENDSILYSNTYWEYRLKKSHQTYSGNLYNGGGHYKKSRYDDDDWRGDSNYYGHGSGNNHSSHQTQIDRADKTTSKSQSFDFTDDYKKKRKAWWDKKLNKVKLNTQQTEKAEEDELFLGCGC